LLKIRKKTANILQKHTSEKSLDCIEKSLGQPINH